MISELVKKCRSYRRYYQEIPVSSDALRVMIDNARLSASARNSQSLKYMVSNEKRINALIFSCLAWAAYLKDWPGPDEGERPAAYIVMLNDTRISRNYFCDDGIAAQSILLTAVEMGLGGCIIASVQHKKLREILEIDDSLEIVQVIALGKPKEEVVLEEVKDDGDIRYWHDVNGVHHVPKRSLDEILIRKL